MQAVDRENKLYIDGKRVSISTEETIISDMIQSNEKVKSKLLDIGCGSGEIAKHYSDLNYDVVGVDFSNIAVDLAKGLGIKAYEMDLDSGLSFDNNDFDFVLAGDVMEHVFDPIFVFSEKIIFCLKFLNSQNNIIRTHLMRWYPDCFKLERALDKRKLQ